MTVLIRGMEMPTWCNDCPFNDKEYDVCVATTDRRSIRIPVWERMRLFHREKWCPLIEVPTPHGRLGDLDELIKHDHQYYGYLPDEFYILVRDIENAPTVIETEEGEGC